MELALAEPLTIIVVDNKKISSRIIAGRRSFFRWLMEPQNTVAFAANSSLCETFNLSLWEGALLEREYLALARTD